jgi:hypothetical protein
VLDLITGELSIGTTQSSGPRLEFDVVTTPVGDAILVKPAGNELIEFGQPNNKILSVYCSNFIDNAGDLRDDITSNAVDINSNDNDIADLEQRVSDLENQ